MLPALLLFDIDGTLLRTSGAGMRAMARAGRRLFADQFRLEAVEPAGYLDTLIFAEATRQADLGDDPAHQERFRAHYLAELSAELAANREVVRAMPGVMGALDLMRQRAADRRDVIVGLLTGNYAAAVPIKLAAVGIDPAWFTITAFAEDGPSRADLVAVALGKYARRVGQPADPKRVLIIGDTPRDVAAAKAHGCSCLAVATGRYDAAALTAAGADLVVADLTDPTPLGRWLDDGSRQTS